MKITVFGLTIPIGWKTCTITVGLLLILITIQINPFQRSIRKTLQPSGDKQVQNNEYTFWITGCSSKKEQHIRTQLQRSLHHLQSAIDVLQKPARHDTCIHKQMVNTGFGSPSSSREATAWYGPMGGTVWTTTKNFPYYPYENKSNREMLLANLQTFHQQLKETLQTNEFVIECSPWNIRCQLWFFDTSWYVGLDLNIHICNIDLTFPLVILHEMAHKYLTFGGHPEQSQPYDSPNAYARVITNLAVCDGQ